MSFRAFVVCEDHTLDQYVAVPVVQALLKHLGKTRAVVHPVTNPRLTGISHVEARFVEIAERYAAIGDLVIFALDRDGLDGRPGRDDRAAAFRHRVSQLSSEVASKTVVVLAIEETEVWALWGARDDLGAPWRSVREERDVKERYFSPLRTTADMTQPGAGRTRLVRLSLASGWASLAAGCLELKDLERSVAGIL